MEEQIKLLRGKLETLQSEAETIYDELNTLFEKAYNNFLDEAEDPDAEETLDAASVWDQVFDDDTSIASAIEVIDAAIGED